MKKLIQIAYIDTLLRGGIVSKKRFLYSMLFNTSDNVIPLFRVRQHYSKSNGFVSRLFLIYLSYRYRVLTDRLNVFLPVETTVGFGIQFPHNFPVVINPSTIIGDNCTIHPCTLIGRDRGKNGAPIIGNNVFIGHGTKIIGNPRIGDWCFISPASVITKDVPSGSVVGAGLNNILPNKDGRKHVEMYL